MPDPRDRILFRWGEELRRRRGQRRRSRLVVMGAAATAALITASAATLAWPPSPAFMWNASASSPIGLYRISAGADVAAGDTVAAWPPAAARDIANRRGYLPAGVPLVKRVAAGPGDRVCAGGETLFVNGILAAVRRGRDPSGRLLPTWEGCRELQPGELLLLTPHNEVAFDGRYFGVTQAADVLGKATLVWPG